MTTTNELTRKAWATKDWVNPGQRVVFGHLFSRGAIFYTDVFEGAKGRGDQVTYSYANKLTGIPVGEGGTLDGNEEALDLGSFKMSINLTRVGVLNPNDDTIEQQRTLVSFPETTRKVIPNRLNELLDSSVFNQLAGFDPTSYTANGTTWSGTNKLFVQGHNTPTAPTTNRILRAGGGANDQAITSSNTMTLDLIDFALEDIDLSDQPIKRFADGTYDLYISPEQLTNLKQDTSGKILWFNSQLAKITGGKENQFEQNLFDTMPCAGEYAGVNIYSAPRVAYGQRSDTSAVITTVRRAVLVGKDALTYGSPFGKPDDSAPFRYFDQLKDFGYMKAMEGRMIFGLKKTVATNSEDVGVYVIATYAAANS
jgi:hypothetical protein